MHPTSAKNPFLQSVRRAVTAGRSMDDGRIVIEGPHLLEEVLDSCWTLDQLIVTPNGRERHGRLLSKIRAEITEIPSRAFEALAGTETSQEIMALVTPPVATWAEVLNGSVLTLVLDGIQDPGNAGAMVRSAEAFGAGGLVFIEGCVHAANGKFLRATAGSIFRLPYLENQKRPHLMAQLRSRELKLYSLAAEAETSLSKADLQRPCAIVVGNEASGVSPELRACSEGIRIPTTQVESLNAAVACSIVLFEAARQRGRL